MSVGDSLAQARSQAGLTIAQVSQRTCIRETIVRGIERDDFSACGGDFYARGHIRSIARVVGLDPDQLIHEYDAAHGVQQEITAAGVGDGLLAGDLDALGCVPPAATTGRGEVPWSTSRYTP